MLCFLSYGCRSSQHRCHHNQEYDVCVHFQQLNRLCQPCWCVSPPNWSYSSSRYCLSARSIDIVRARGFELDKLHENFQYNTASSLESSQLQILALALFLLETCSPDYHEFDRARACSRAIAVCCCQQRRCLPWGMGTCNVPCRQTSINLPH